MSNQKPLPEGWRYIAVDSSFDDLVFWLDRCSTKGHLDNCYDLIEPWKNFNYIECEQTLNSGKPMTEDEITLELADRIGFGDEKFQVVNRSDLVRIVRGVEAFHDIRETK